MRRLDGRPYTRVANEDREKILQLYVEGHSPADMTLMFPYERTTIKEVVRRAGLIRNQSDASKLAIKKGKKANWFAAMPASWERNRFNPKKAPWAGKPWLHPKWIKDRSKLKNGRGTTEERTFLRSVIEKRGFTCELTGASGTMSGHHIKPFWKYPELRYDEQNIIVIQLKIHKYFHRKYGMKSTEEDWYKFVNNGEYLAL